MSRTARPRTDEGKLDEPLNELIAARALALVERYGLSLTDMERMTGIASSRMSALLRNEQEWRTWQIRVVAEALSTTPRYLVGADDVDAIPVSADEARLLVLIRQGGDGTRALDLMTELVRRARTKGHRKGGEGG